MIQGSIIERSSYVCGILILKLFHQNLC